MDLQIYIRLIPDSMFDRLETYHSAIYKHVYTHYRAVRTLDLNLHFSQIAAQLDDIVKKCFGEKIYEAV